MILSLHIRDYTNSLYSAYMPILSSAVFDNTGKPYDVSRVLTPEFRFDRDAYDRYSRVFLPITYVLAYTAQFAGLSALVTHTACWHGKDMWLQTKQSFTANESNGKTEYRRIIKTRSSRDDAHEPTGSNSSEEQIADDLISEDVHSRLMRRYDDCPLSWYLTTFVLMLAIGIFVVE